MFCISYSFNAKVGGFNGKLDGHKIYHIDYYESVDELINDALKILKTGRGAEITFERFNDDGMDVTTTSLSRIYTGYGGVTEGVTWRSNAQSWRANPEIEKININRKEVKAFILRAIEMYREEEAKSEAA